MPKQALEASTRSSRETVGVAWLSGGAIKSWNTLRLFVLRWGEGLYWKFHFSCVQLPLRSFVLRMFFVSLSLDFIL